MWRPPGSPSQGHKVAFAEWDPQTKTYTMRIQQNAWVVVKETSKYRK